jgi:hypothetical protein
MDGQAQAPESEGLDSLADFLSDNPDKETEEELTAEESTSDGDDSDAKPQTDDETEEEVEDEESETEAKEEKPTTEALIEVTVKDKDGNDVVEKVTQTELKNGYIRQAKFTSSMQGLAERETQAVQVFQQKHSELRNNYLQQAEFATQAIARLAGFRSADEMSQLAAQDLQAGCKKTIGKHKSARFSERLSSKLKLRDNTRNSKQSSSETKP